MTASSRRDFMIQSAGMLAATAIIPEAAALARIPSGAEPAGIGLIGAGRQGRSILAELGKLDAAHVVAMCDSDASRLESGLRRVQGVEGFDDHRKLLERRDIHAVIVATPTHRHAAIVADALGAGKHVYCEAPIAHTIEDARAIVAAARGAGNKLVVHAGFEPRSNPMYKLARTFFRSDSVRTLVSMHGQYHKKMTWRTPAPDPAREQELNWRLDPAVSIGLPGEFGSLQFDTFHFFTGRYPQSVRGSGAVMYHRDGREIADTVHCDLDFGEGARLHYSATLANSFGGQHELFCGSNAAIKLTPTFGWMFKEADAPTQGWEVYANRQQFHNEEGITLIADATKLAAQQRLKEGVGLPNQPLYYCLADFLSSVIDGAPVACSIDEGFRATAVGILAHRAVETGELVAIDPSMLGGA